MSVFLSSAIARLPIRDITRLGDNKSDPNLETQTYGLFSTCEATMRNSIVNRGISEIIFVTTVDGLGRSLVGRYELGWIAEFTSNDVAFAARASKFIRPIPVAQIPGQAGKELQLPLRNYKVISDEVASDLRSLIAAADDRTSDYLVEIARLERLSLSRTGLRYPSWDRAQGFDWQSAGPYLAPVPANSSTSATTSPSGTWKCSDCGAIVTNVARLRLCNSCRALETLVALEITQ